MLAVKEINFYYSLINLLTKIHDNELEVSILESNNGSSRGLDWKKIDRILQDCINMIQAGTWKTHITSGVLRCSVLASRIAGLRSRLKSNWCQLSHFLASERTMTISTHVPLFAYNSDFEVASWEIRCLYPVPRTVLDSLDYHKSRASWSHWMKLRCVLRF